MLSAAWCDSAISNGDRHLTVELKISSEQQSEARRCGFGIQVKAASSLRAFAG